MAGRLFDTEDRRATIAVHSVRREMTSGDLSSLYTMKSGTPLLYKVRGLSDDVANSHIFTPSPVVRTNVTWDSATSDITCFSEDGSMFCNRFNVHNCLLYLNQEMTSVGLLPLFTSDADTVDIVRFINNTYSLLKKQQAAEKIHSELSERDQRRESDITLLSQSIERLKTELDDSERSRVRLELTMAQLRSSNRDLSSKLKTEKDEVRRLESVMQHRDAQFRHESRKKEQELEKMKDRMHRLITDKSNKKASGLTLSSALEKASKICDGETDLMRTVLGTYEDRQKVLLTENCDLRRGLLNLQQELVTMLRADRAKDVAATQQAASENSSVEQDPTEQDALLLRENSFTPAAGTLAEACFEMPYDVTGGDVLAGLKQQCLLLKEHINSIEKSRRERELASSSSEESVDQVDLESVTTKSETEKRQVEMLRNKLCEYEFVIQQHQELLMQTLQPPGDAGDVSFLVETEHLEEKEDLIRKEKLFRQQKVQLDEERQKLMELATHLAKQRAEVEHMRLEVLHKEFMLLTPFRTNRSQHLSDSALVHVEMQSKSVAATPSAGSGFLSGMPTTADLFRQLGLVGTTCRRNSNGRSSIDGFMFITKSAIRDGLSKSLANQRQAHCDDLLTNIHEVENDEDALQIDAVKVLQFDQHEDSDS